MTLKVNKVPNRMSAIAERNQEQAAALQHSLHLQSIQTLTEVLRVASESNQTTLASNVSDVLTHLVSVFIPSPVQQLN